MNPRDDAPAPLDPVPEPHTGLIGRFRNYFLTGLVVAGPLAITVWLTWSFVTWVDDLVRPFIPMAYRPETYLPGRSAEITDAVMVLLVASVFALLRGEPRPTGETSLTATGGSTGKEPAEDRVEVLPSC